MPAEQALRVAQVCPYDLSRPGGVQGQALGLAEALERLGHDALVVASDDGPVGWDGRNRFAAGRAVAVPANGSIAPVGLSPTAAVRAVRAVQRWSADVVHLHEPLAPVLGYGFLVTGRWPIVATFHRSGRGGGYRLMTPLGRIAGRRISVRCAVSEVARQTAAAVCGGSYELLFNGVDLARFAPAAGQDASAARPRAGDPPAVFFLGRHEERKGLEVLLQAFDVVGAPAELWIGGRGPETDRLRSRWPDSPRIRWLGILDDQAVVDRLHRASALCAPSLGGESFGVVLLEAMAAGCAVVSSDIPGYRAAAGGHATLVPPGDPAALAAALRTVLSSPPGAAARAAARAHARAWSMDRLAARYVDLYRRALGDGGARGAGAGGADQDGGTIAGR